MILMMVVRLLDSTILLRLTWTLIIYVMPYIRKNGMTTLMRNFTFLSKHIAK